MDVEVGKLTIRGRTRGCHGGWELRVTVGRGLSHLRRADGLSMALRSGIAVQRSGPAWRAGWRQRAIRFELADSTDAWSAGLRARPQ